jgi:hypothetical protein
LPHRNASPPQKELQDIESPDFVDLGVAAFTKATLDGSTYSVSEPLVWEALFKLLREDRNRELLGELLLRAIGDFASTGSTAGSASEMGKRAELAIALVLWYMTEPGKHLLHLVRRTIEEHGLDVELPGWCA